MISASEALHRLVEGNSRFVSGTPRDGSDSGTRLAPSSQDQEPFAIILGCSDSRVPAEIVFDQGLGDLFVIRVAGNIVAPTQIGSVEFAAQQFGTRLVVVLGHSRCGAVTTTLNELEHPSAGRSPGIISIVNRIRPSVQPLFESDLRHNPDKLLRHAVRANVQAAANDLRTGSRLLENLMQEDNLLIVSAEYSLETGVVEFFDGLPAAFNR